MHFPSVIAVIGLGAPMVMAAAIDVRGVDIQEARDVDMSERGYHPGHYEKRTWHLHKGYPAQSPGKRADATSLQERGKKAAAAAAAAAAQSSLAALIAQAQANAAAANNDDDGDGSVGGLGWRHTKRDAEIAEREPKGGKKEKEIEAGETETETEPTETETETKKKKGSKTGKKEVESEAPSTKEHTKVHTKEHTKTKTPMPEKTKEPKTKEPKTEEPKTKEPKTKATVTKTKGAEHTVVGTPVMNAKAKSTRTATRTKKAHTTSNPAQGPFAPPTNGWRRN